LKGKGGFKKENNNGLRRSFHNYIKKNENEKCKIVLSMTFHRAIWLEGASLNVAQISKGIKTLLSYAPCFRIFCCLSYREGDSPNTASSNNDEQRGKL